MRVANPIYKEVILRVLAASVEDSVSVDPRRFILADRRLDLRRILDEFAAFWREHGDVLTNGLSYNEAAPQLVLMAFLQRVVNGGGVIDREYGIGRGRIDLLVRWPYDDENGKRTIQGEAIELKVWKDQRKDPLRQGLTQLDDYLRKTGLDTGVLVIFDRRSNAKDIEKRTRFKTAKTPSGKRFSAILVPPFVKRSRMLPGTVFDEGWNMVHGEPLRPNTSYVIEIVEHDRVIASVEEMSVER
jgi:hypothetical protein